MLLGGDLGLLCSLVAVVLGWLFVRRKLRRAAARREEVRRLMAFASEEAARVEREAAAVYRSYGSPLPTTDTVAEEPIIGSGSPSVRQLQYQCEVCFSPTTTRCKQCKSVRYCSRRCQISHWRQGHKDECHSFSTHKNDDAGAHSDLEEFKQNEIQSSQNVNGIEVVDSTKPVELSSEEYTVTAENKDTETEASDDLVKTDINVKKEQVQLLPDEPLPSAISKDTSVASSNNLKGGNKYDAHSTMSVESIKPLLSEQPGVTNPGYGTAPINVSNKVKSGCIDIDEKSKSSTSAVYNDTEEHLLSEPSSPSFDFWFGRVEPIRSKINQVHEDDVNMTNSRSSFRPSSDRIDVHVEMSRPSTNRVLADYPSPAVPTHKESIAVSKVSEDGSRRPQSLAPKQLDCEIGESNGTIDTSKHQQNDSSRLTSSEARFYSSACTRKPHVLDVQSAEKECFQGDSSCSLGNSVRSAISGTNPSVRVVDQRRASNFIKHGSLAAGSGKMGRYEGSFPYDVFVKLYNWNKVELRPFGLQNCGNSCYANAVLQCLAFTPPLTAYFLQGLHAKSCQRKEWCFTCEFETLVKKALESNYPLSPVRIMSQMQKVASHLGNGREEDAHEFLRYAIEAMQNVCVKEAGVNVSSSPDEETTLVGLTFGGYLQSKIVCMRCGGKSKQHERIMDLTVEIGGQIGTLEDALHQFTQYEILDGENKYQCGRCNSYEKAKKKLTLWEAPNVLTIALKRFQSGKFGKLNKPVKFQNILNLAPYMYVTSDKSPIYQLYGVLVHLDVSNATFSGHYVCYIKNNQGRWFKADDSMVQPVELEKVLSKDAYMLFYARCSPRAPRRIRSSTVIRNSIFRPHPLHSRDILDDQVAPNIGFNRNQTPHHDHSNNRTNLVEEETPSECSSSSFFSESESNSTESSNRGSVSTNDDIMDDPTGHCWSRQWRRSASDSDSLSQSSSSSSPLCTRRSHLAELDRYSSDVSSSNMDGDYFWETGKSVEEALCSSNKESIRCCIRVSSCRDNESSRLGSNNKSGVNVKKVYI